MAGYKKMLALIAAIMVPLSLSSCETGPNAELTAGTDNGTQTAENREIVMDSEFVQQPGLPRLCVHVVEKRLCKCK